MKTFPLNTGLLETVKSCVLTEGKTTQATSQEMFSFTVKTCNFISRNLSSQLLG